MPSVLLGPLMLMRTASTPNIFLLYMQHSAGGSNVQMNILKNFQAIVT